MIVKNHQYSDRKNEKSPFRGSYGSLKTLDLAESSWSRTNPGAADAPHRV